MPSSLSFSASTVLFPSLMAGIWAGHQLFYVSYGARFAESFLSVSWFALVAIAAFAVYSYQREKRGDVTGADTGMLVLAVTFFFIFGASVYARYYLRHHVEWPGKRQMVSGVVVSVPEAKGKWMRCDIETSAISGAPGAHRSFKLRAYLPDSVPLGTTISGEAWVGWPKRHRGSSFDYALWLYVQGYSGTAYFRPTTNLASRGGEKGHSPSLSARRLQQRLVRAYNESGLGQEYASLASALTLGDRSRVSQETRAAYNEAGAAHLLALSGLHLGIIIGFFSWLLGRRLLRFSHWRFLTVPLLTLFVWAYAFVAGLPASLVRAALMATFILLTFLLRREVQLLNSLFLAAFIMLLLRPTYLFDVGAQLSFLAVLGIGMLYSPLVDLMKYHSYAAYIWLHRHHLWWAASGLMVSASSWLFTSPLVYHYFHRLTPWGIVLNLIYVPLTTVLIYACLLLLLCSLCHAPSFLLSAICYIIRLIVDVQMWVM